MTIVAVTGANGFVGRAAVAALAPGHTVRALVRGANAQIGSGVTPVVADLSNAAALRDAIGDADAVVHLADDPRRDGDEGAGLALARAVLDASGTKRLIFASSVYAGRDDSAYARRKLAIERLFAAAGERAVGLRLVPVYDGSDHGSVGLLRRLVRRGLPLPLGRATAERDYLAAVNAGSAIRHLVDLDEAGWARVAGRVWTACDSDPVSTAELIGRLAAAEGRVARLLPVPAGLVTGAARLAGRQAMAEGAFGPLRVPPGENLRSATDWTPPVSMAEQLRRST